MLHIMNAENWKDPPSERRYQIHQTIDTTF